MDSDKFDPEKLGQRSQRAYWALGDFYDGRWHKWRDAVAAMLAASDLTPKSCSDILRGMESTGEAVRRGVFSPRSDRREVLFVNLDQSYDIAANWQADGYTEGELAGELSRRSRFLELRAKVAVGESVPPAEWESIATLEAWMKHQNMSS